jgi:23S rRNA (adenine2503-C2)-methyltransferase
LLGFTRTDLLPLVGKPARAAQVFKYVYQSRARDFEGLQSIPFSARKRLSDSADLNLPSVHKRFDAADGTRRYLLRMEDGELVESVLIPSADRDTLCISSQIGCALGCTFCLTGKMGFVRDLSTAEIVGQVLAIQGDSIPGRTSGRFSVVFMGMGEPLQNYDAVIKAIQILSDDHGLKLPASRITVSTAGLIQGIQRLACEPVFPNLSISLTGVTDNVRDQLMPINRRYPIGQLIGAIRALPHSRQRRVMIECVMIKGVTDSVEDARELARLIRGMPLKVNLIPLNPAAEIAFEPARRDSILRYQQVLIGSGTATFIRRTRGNDVSGACGQLKRKVRGGSAPSAPFS